MPNLGFSQTKWDETFRVISQYLLASLEKWGVWRQLRDREAQVVESFDQSARLSNWDLTGVVLGTNAEEDGELFVDLTVVGANATVDLFRDPAKAAPDKVATGVVAFPGTITLAQVNASGMGGTVDVAAAPANDTDIVIRVVQGLQLRIENALPKEDADTGPAKSRFLNQVEDTMVSDARTAFSDILAFTTSEFSEDNLFLARRLKAPEDVVGTLHTYEYDTANGQVQLIEETGVLARLIDAMDDQAAPAGAQSILKNTASLGSLVADPDNLGVVVLAAATAHENALRGTLDITLEDETVGSETYNVSLRLDEELIDGSRFIAAENVLTVKQPWTDRRIGASFTLNRGPIVESGDAGGILATYVVTGETEANTDNGKVYFRVTRTTVAANWLIEAFFAAARTPADLIGSVTETGAVGVVNKTISQIGGISVSFDFNRAAADAALPLNGNFQDSDIDLKTGRDGDAYTVAVTNDYAGNIQTAFAYLFQVPLRSSAAPTIDDDMGRPLPILFEGD